MPTLNSMPGIPSVYRWIIQCPHTRVNNNDTCMKTLKYDGQNIGFITYIPSNKVNFYKNN